MSKHYYLVTGMMRSGTTFVCNLLNSQENSVCFADYPTYLLNQSVQLGIDDINKPLTDKEKNILISYLRSEGLQKNVPCITSITPSDFSNWLELFKLSLDATHTNNEKFLGSKKTNQVKYLDQLMLAGVKILYLVRDPRDIILSSQNRFSGFNLYNYLSDWEQMYSSIKRLRSNPNFMLCRFEDLLNSNKERTLKEISDFIGINVRSDFEMLKFRDQANYIENSSFNDVHSLFDKNALNRWKKDENQSLEIVQYVSAVLDKDIDELGYDRLELRKGVLKYTSDFKRFKMKKRLQIKSKNATKMVLDMFFRRSIYK